MAQKTLCLCPCGQKVDQKTLRRHFAGHARPQIRALQMYANAGSPTTPLPSLRKRHRHPTTSPSTPLQVKKQSSKLRTARHITTPQQLPALGPKSSPQRPIFSPLDPPPSPLITGVISETPLPPSHILDDFVGHTDEAQSLNSDADIIPFSPLSSPVQPHHSHLIIDASDDEEPDPSGPDSNNSDDEMASGTFRAQGSLVGDWEDINEELLRELESLGMWNQLLFLQ
jgi:hypothetical protein